MAEQKDLTENESNENKQSLANFYSAEAVKTSDEDEITIEKFLQAQKSKNTEYKTKSDLNAWKKFSVSMNEAREMNDIPASELDVLLSKFFISFCKY